jgi:hypothetical protein
VCDLLFRTSGASAGDNADANVRGEISSLAFCWAAFVYPPAGKCRDAFRAFVPLHLSAVSPGRLFHAGLSTTHSGHTIWLRADMSYLELKRLRDSDDDSFRCQAVTVWQTAPIFLKSVLGLC